nr:hypothetical protein BDOA9_0163070 [Bradyrhizobium sp. DOA9]
MKAAAPKFFDIPLFLILLVDPQTGLSALTGHQLPILHCGKCQENVVPLANFRHRLEANNANPT